MSARPALLLFAFAIAACDERSGPDASVDGGVDAGSAIDPIAPTAPAPIDWSPCPTGWRARTALDGVDLAMVCDPWPESGRESCTGTSAHFPGEPGCAPVGGECAANAWPTALPSARILYVEAGASGDGTMNNPFGTIAQAVAVAVSGDVIALHSGVHDGPAILPAGVSLYGACPANTTVRSSSPGIDGTVRIASGSATIRSLRITGPQPGIEAGPGAATVEVRDVVIEQARFSGIHVTTSAALNATGLLVRATEPDGGRFGMAMMLEFGADATVTRAVFASNTQAGVHSTDAGSTFTGRSVSVFDTVQRPLDNFGGSALRALDGGSASCEECVLESSRRISAMADGGDLTLRASVVRDTIEGALAVGETLPMAWGAAVQTAGQLDLDDVWIDRSRDLGIYASSDSTLNGRDVIVTRTSARSTDGGGGNGLFAQSGAQVEITGFALAQNHEVGVAAIDATTLVTLHDARILQTLARTIDTRGGRGVSLEEGASIVLDRAIVEDSREMGIVLRTASHATVRDTVVRRVAPDGMGHGYGILVAMGSTMTIERASVEEATIIGLIVGTDSHVQATDLSVRATQPRPSVFDLGRGVHVQANGELLGTRLAIVETRELGLSAALAGRATIDGLSIISTQIRACAEMGTCSGEAGFGLAIYPDSTIAVTDFVLRDNGIAGAVVIGGTLSLTEGRIAGHPVGLSIQDMRDPASVLGGGVLFVDNDLDFDSAVLPLPDPGIDE